MAEGGTREELWRSEEGRRSADAPERKPLDWGPQEKPPPPGPRSTVAKEALWKDDDGLEAEEERSDNGRRLQRGPDATKRRRVRRILKVVAAFAILALVADIAYSVYGVAIRLQSAADNLESVRAALADGNVPAARSFVADATEDAEAAVDLTERPAFWVLRATPDGRYVTSIAEAAELATDAGEVGLTAAAALGGNAQDMAASLFANGRIDIAAIEKVQGPVAESSRLLDRADELLQGLEEPWLDPVSEAGFRAEERISEAAGSVGVADQLLGVLPEMFGSDAPRRYLLGFQALGEARATGGLVGFTGTLEAKNGSIELVELGSILRSIPSQLDEPVDAPEWFEANYGPQSALTQPQQVNTSPNYPVVADVMLAMFEAQTGRPYDGMVLMDPVALEHLLPATDPLDVPGWDEPITAENVVEVMLRDSYVEFTPNEQNRFLAAVVDEFWNRVSEGDFDAAKFATGLGEATSSQHFRIHAVDPEADEAMAAANADGDYTHFDPNVQIAFHNNYSANKVDYFLRREIVTDITLERDAAVVYSKITMTNTAPNGPPSLLLGPSQTYNPNDPPGMNRMLFNTLLPIGAEDITFGSGKDRKDRLDPVIYEDEGHPVPWQVVEIPAGEQVTIRMSYRVPNPYRPADDGGISFRFALDPQPAVVPDTFSVTVSAPNGYGLLTSEQRLDESTPPARYLRDGTLEAPALLDLRLIPETP